MARRKFTDSEREIMRGIANSLRKLLDERKWNQVKLAEKSKMSTSVISDYMNEKTLATPGSVQMLADAFGVSKSDIDPTFKGKQDVNQDVKIKFFNELEELGLDLTDPKTQELLKRAAQILIINKD